MTARYFFISFRRLPKLQIYIDQSVFLRKNGTDIRNWNIKKQIENLSGKTKFISIFKALPYENALLIMAAVFSFFINFRRLSKLQIFNDHNGIFFNKIGKDMKNWNPKTNWKSAENYKSYEQFSRCYCANAARSRIRHVTSQRRGVSPSAKLSAADTGAWNNFWRCNLRVACLFDI